MRSLLLASAASFVLLLAHPGFAQSTAQPGNQPRAAGQPAPAPADAAPAALIGAGQEPLSRSASNIDPGDTTSTIAPRLPAPPLGPDATTPDLLHAARDALGRNATGEAQEALERAETRLLDRSTEPSRAGTPDDRDAVRLIGQAREALGHHDLAQAAQAIDQALHTPAVMQSAANM